MKKLTIEVYGKGCESFIHKLSNEQFRILSKRKVTKNKMDEYEIQDILGVDSITDTDNILIGLYPGSINIKVIDEDGGLIWESDDDFEFSDYDEEYLFYDNEYLMVQDYQKGLFFSYQLELHEEFNENLLIACNSEVLDGVADIVTDIKYGDIEMQKEFGDTRSNGVYYSLSL